MCTVTFIPRRNGYALGMNRDEKLSRIEALPPMHFRVGKRMTLFPSEPNGGTWIGVNDAGVTFALINWYSVPSLPRPSASRGDVVRALLEAHTVEMAHEMIGIMPLAATNPFRLIGIFPEANAVAEWRWNTRVLKCLSHPWRTNIWISSGHDEPGAQRTRGKTFAQALRQPSAGTLPWLRRLHGSHAPECGPYSLCMHRSNAATLSYTEIVLSESIATMHYRAGPPCCNRRHPSAPAKEYRPTPIGNMFSPLPALIPKSRSAILKQMPPKQTSSSACSLDVRWCRLALLHSESATLRHVMSTPSRAAGDSDPTAD